MTDRTLATAERSDLEAAIEENPEAVAEFVTHLDTVNELVEVLELGEDALDDEMVRSLAETGSGVGELADTAAEPDTRRGIERTLAGIGAAERADTDPVGTVGLLRALHDPDVQAGLGYVIAIARALGQSQSNGATD